MDTNERMDTNHRMLWRLLATIGCTAAELFCAISTIPALGSVSPSTQISEEQLLRPARAVS